MLQYTACPADPQPLGDIFMGSRKNWILILMVLGIIYCAPLPGLAQDPQADDEGIGLILSLSTVEQFEADVGDSRFDVSSYLVKLDKNLVQSQKMILNLGASFVVSDYSFSGPPADPWSDPWKTIRSADAGLAFILPTEGNWSYILAGTLGWMWEEGADVAEGQVQGIIAAATYAFRDDRHLGVGVGVFEGLEEKMIFPYAAVSWKFNEKLSLSNPLRVGPAGPAGLELTYEASDRWQIGGGVADRSFRFRLDDEGIAPDGIGEMTGVLTWVRASRRASPKVMVDIYAGAILSGEVSMEDSGGRKLENESFGTVPLAAVTLELSL